MIVDVEVRGRRHRVEVVSSDDGGDEVIVDGRRLRCDLVNAAGWWSMLVADEQAAVTRSHEVVIEDDRTGTLGVWMDGALVSVRLRDRRRSRRQAVDDVGGQAAQALRAPMPGRIVKVLVAAGQRVAVRQPLVVIEAMKMENELRSTVAGVISEVRVAAGSAVEAEALLVVVTPENGTGA